MQGKQTGLATARALIGACGIPKSVPGSSARFESPALAASATRGQHCICGLRLDGWRKDIAELTLPDRHRGARSKGLPQELLRPAGIRYRQHRAMSVNSPGGGGIADAHRVDGFRLRRRGPVGEMSPGEFNQGGISPSDGEFMPPRHAAASGTKAEGILNGGALPRQETAQGIAEPAGLVSIQRIARNATPANLVKQAD